MEGRAHSKQTYAQQGHVSFMDADLEVCRNDFVATFKPRPPIRSATIPNGTAHNTTNSTTNGATNKTKPRVAVVGAGLAGLRCAEVLVRRGFAVTLFEARDHVGGRICQAPFAGIEIDTGASWVHGTEDNPIADLARASGTEMCTIPEDMLVFSPSGAIVPNDKVEAGLDRVWSLISDAFRESNQRGDEIDPRTSLKDYFVDRMKDSDDEDERQLVLMLAEQWGGFIGDEWHKQSLRWFWFEECLDGENLFVPNTHAGIINGILAPVKASPACTVRLSTKVTSITTDTSSTNPSVAITTSSDAESLIFDEVVVAIPLGCLKKSMVQFSPPLPDVIIKAVKDASISSFEKVFIAFSTAWWEGSNHSIDVDDSKDEDSKDNGPGFVHYLTPEYLPFGQPAFSMEIITLSNRAVFKNHAQPMVFVQTYGECAAHIISLLRPHSPDSPEYLATLSRFFAPYLALLPHYDAASPECTPTAAISTAWLDDDLGGNGSYTNFKTSDTAPGEVVIDESVRAMREGQPERGLWFAGEHVAPFVAMGTTTGAYWSGECVGMRIAAAHGLVEEEEISGRQD